MTAVLARLVPQLSLRQVSSESLGFAPWSEPVGERLEGPMRAFVLGFNAARREDDDVELARRLAQEHDSHHLGFAFEGAGADRALRDLLSLGRRSRLEELSRGGGRDYDYLLTVGAGLALGRLPWGRLLFNRYLASLDPLLAWCLADGLGFYCGIFEHRRYLDGQARPPAPLPEWARPVFDAGLGRSLWWAESASPARIRRGIDRFAVGRRAELWFGVGIACSYAGGVNEEWLREFERESGRFRISFLSAVPFACRLREQGGNRSPVTDLAAETLLGLSTDAAGSWLVELLELVLARIGDDPRVRRERTYGLLRAEVEAALSPQQVAAELGRGLQPSRVGGAGP